MHSFTTRQNQKKYTVPFDAVLVQFRKIKYKSYKTPHNLTFHKGQSFLEHVTNSARSHSIEISTLRNLFNDFSLILLPIFTTT